MEAHNCLFTLFFFKQKTAYEMRISDWSSDVCSSDLQIFHRQTKPRTAIVGVDDPTSGGIYEALKAADEQNVVGISGERAVPGGIYVQGGVLIDDSTGQRIEAIDLKEIRSEEHTSELQSLMRISYAVFCLKTKKTT